MQSSSTIVGISPSFTSHSSTNLADVAARVVEEFRHENGDDYDHLFNFNGYDHDYDDTNTLSQKSNDHNSESDEDENDDEFEFAVVNSSSISTDEIYNISSSPRYPLFDRSLLLDVDPNLIQVVNNNDSDETAESIKPSSSSSLVVRLPLRKLFSEERDFSSWSSSEADDLDGVNPGTYCVWKPKQTESESSSSGRSKKSNSTGDSSRRWKFRHLRDILYRSNSDVKDSSPFLFFKPSISSSTNKDEKVTKVEKISKVASAAAGDGGAAVAQNEKDPANSGGSRRRRSYLPSGQALVGAFTNVSRSNRNLRPFLA